ncbi:MAG: NAD(P)H-dependent glycerol-3-phosphate dehydrogenase [Candidatus Bathyarchaeia archaeon]
MEESDLLRITILGAGVMGAAITKPLIDNGHEISLWGTEYDIPLLESMARNGIHPKLGIRISRNVKIFPPDKLEEAVRDSKIVLIAVSSQGTKNVSRRMVPFLKKGMVVVTVAKGLEKDSDGKIHTMAEVIENVIPENMREEIYVAAMGGPQVASEVAQGVHTAVVCASQKIHAAKLCKEALTTPAYIVETTRDLIGVELCAALKNVYAIGVSFCDGLKDKKGLQTIDNTKATLFTYAANEMAKIVKAKRGKVKTVLGLAGVGDLDVTCRKAAGRNRLFGRLLGQGLNTEEALERTRKSEGLVEGFETAQKGYELAKELELENKIRIDEDAPFLRQIYSVLFERKNADEAIVDLFRSRRI